MRRAASGMRTRSSHCRARRRASSRERLRWTLSGSAIWAPMVMWGVRAVSGSWKIMVMREPRMRFSARGFRPSSSWPRNRAEPFVWPLRAKRPITAMKVWLLPEPLSPTIPTHSPRPTSRLTLRTASTSPSGVSKPTDRSEIDSTASCGSVTLAP